MITCPTLPRLTRASPLRGLSLYFWFDPVGKLVWHWHLWFYDMTRPLPPVAAVQVTVGSTSNECCNEGTGEARIRPELAKDFGANWQTAILLNQLYDYTTRLSYLCSSKTAFRHHMQHANLVTSGIFWGSQNGGPPFHQNWSKTHTSVDEASELPGWVGGSPIFPRPLRPGLKGPSHSPAAATAACCGHSLACGPPPHFVADTPGDSNPPSSRGHHAPWARAWQRGPRIAPQGKARDNLEWLKQTGRNCSNSLSLSLSLIVLLHQQPH